MVVHIEISELRCLPKLAYYGSMFEVSHAFTEKYPKARVGFLLVSGFENSASCELLRSKRESLEHELRERFGMTDRTDLRKFGNLAVYDSYYRSFKKTYHVHLQLESVAKKNRKIPEVSPVVETMFMAELSSFLLTAVHDADLVNFPVTVDLGDGVEVYQALSGSEEVAKKSDMLVRDRDGITSSVIHGPDARTSVTANTRRALFVVYLPTSESAVSIENHFEDIIDSIRRFSSSIAVEQRLILP